MRKTISFILALVLILSQHSISLAENTWDFNGNHKVDNQKELELYTEQVLQQSIVIKKGGKYLKVNYDTYRKYDKIIVYGHPFTDSTEMEYYNKGKSRMEQRYLGYDKSGNTVLNTYWVDVDVPISTKKPDQWNYISKSYGYSWKEIKKRDPNLYEYMLQAYLKGNDFNLNESNLDNPNFNVMYINKLNNSSYHSGYLDRTKLTMESSWKNAFVIDTNTRSTVNGREYYQTWNGPPMADGLTFTKKLKVDKEYTMYANENSITIPVTIEVTANLPNKYTKESHIETFSIEFKGNEAESHYSKTVKMDTKITFNRNELLLGKNDIELEAKSELKTTYGDVYGINITGDTIINVEEAKDPYITLLTDSKPFAKIWEGGDFVPVAIDVESHVFGVNPEEIQSYTLKVDGTHDYVVSGTNVAHTLFNLQLDCSALKNNLKQKYIDKRWSITAEAVLKDGTVMHIEGEEQTMILRESIPEPTPEEPDPEPEFEPPVVRINSRKKVKLGDPLTISALAKSPQGFDIVSYDWKLGGDHAYDYADEKRFNHYFDSEGYKDIEVEVFDEKNSSAMAEKEILVTPPTVEAIIDYDGILKPYRAIEVNTDRTNTPKKFPILDKKTDWTVSAEHNLIYDRQRIDGHRSFNFMSTEVGDIEFSAYLENTKGYNDTTKRTITIMPDEPPVADFTSLGVVYRNNEKKATLSIFNKSYSPDNDKLGNLKVWVTLNGDNNKSFEDAADYKELVYNGPNIPIIQHEVYSVGKYKIDLEVEETYTTLPGYEHSVIYLSDDTSDKPLEESIIEVDNLAPSMNVELLKNKVAINMDFQVGDFNGMTKGEVESYVNNVLTPELEANGYILENYNIHGGIEEQVKEMKEFFRGNNRSSNHRYPDIKYFNKNIAVMYFQRTHFKEYIDELYLFDLEKEKTVKVNLPIDDKEQETKFSDLHENQGRLFAIFDVSDVNRYHNGSKDYDTKVYILEINKKDLSYEFHEIDRVKSKEEIEYQSLEVSPDGQYISYVANHEGYDQHLYVYDLEEYDRWGYLRDVDTVSYEYDKNSKYIRYNRQYYDLAERKIIGYPEGGFESIEPVPVSTDYGIEVDNSGRYNSTNTIYYNRLNNLISNSLNYLNIPYTAKGERISLGGAIRNEPGRLYQLFTMAGPPLGVFNVYDNYFSKYNDNIIGFGAMKVITTTNTSQNIEALDPSKDNYYVIIDNSNNLKDTYYTNEIIDNAVMKNVNVLGVSDGSNTELSQITEFTNGFMVNNLTTFKDQLLKKLNEKYRTTTLGDAVILLAGESYEFDTMYWDYEDDPMYSGGYKLTHENPLYFENSNGIYPESGKYQSLKSGDQLIINQVGKYLFEPSVQDNPSEDPKFANYRKWSDDGIKNNILVHRKPIADFDVNLYKDGYTISDKSYDLDHQSEGDKGIIEWDWKWRKSDTIWAKGLPEETDIKPEEKYYFNLRVKDKEGEWSDPTIKEYETDGILKLLPLTLEAELKSSSPTNPLTKFKSNSNVVWHSIKTTYWHNNIHLELSLWDGSKQLGKTKSINYDPSVGLQNGVDISWNDLNYFVDSNLVQHDKTYSLKIEAIDNLDDTQRATVTKPITIFKNNAPQITKLEVTPKTIYEGDQINVEIGVLDLDLDDLTVDVELYEGNKQRAQNSFTNVAKDGKYESLNLRLLKEATKGVYTLKVKVSDPLNAKDQAETTFVANELNIQGRVKHTEKWNENRLKYNNRKGGDENSPRDYNTFWSGEAFVLEADTSDIDPESDVYAKSVHVEIIDDPKYKKDKRIFETYLTSKDGTLWTGKIAEEGMMLRWGYYDPVPLTFRFTVQYSNGTIKTDDVKIIVDSRDTYWKERRVW